MNKQSIGYTLVFTFVVTFVFVFLLSMANQTTVERVRLNQQIARQRGVLSALGVEYSTAEDVQRQYARVETLEAEDETLYRISAEGRTVYAKEFVGAGLWGAISGVIGVEESLDRMVGLVIVSHNETPGLGGRIEESWWQEQFRGQRIPNARLQVGPAGTGDTNRDNERVDSLTGATRTSDAMEVIINKQLEEMRRLVEGVRR